MFGRDVPFSGPILGWLDGQVLRYGCGSDHSLTHSRLPLDCASLVLSSPVRRLSENGDLVLTTISRDPSIDDQ